jgi:glucokinase
MIAAGKAVGIDIGGTKTAVATVDGRGGILREMTIPTDSEQGFARGLGRIADTVARVLDRTGWTAGDLHGIGIGCAGPVDPGRGTIHNPYTLPGWEDADIVTPLREQFACPVVLENDADMALLGECHAGVGLGSDPVVMLTFGTGIGGAALIDGKLLRGASGGHPELGHVPVGGDGPRCYCGTGGCLESIASGSALSAAAAAHGLGDAPRLLARAARGDPAAERIREGALAAVAAATWTILHMLLPQRIIFGGGMMDEHYDTFAAPALEAIARATLAPRGAVTVARAALGGRAGLVGAAGAVMKRPTKED